MEKCKLLILMLCCYHIFMDHWRVIICHIFQKGQPRSSLFSSLGIEFPHPQICCYLSSVHTLLVCLYSTCQGDDK